MKRLLCIAALLVAVPLVAQDNPVIGAARTLLERNSKNLVGAAENMPADKYTYKPTPAQETFGHMVAHTAEANYSFCSKVSGTPAPDNKVSDADGKDKLVAALRSSFDFCSTALPKATDSQLAAEVDWFGGRKASKALVLFALTGSWADHYAHMAEYLRLNGLLPPTAQRPAAAPAPKKD